MGKKINLRSVASLLDGFNATYGAIGRVMQDRDLREISRAKVGEQDTGAPMPAVNDIQAELDNDPAAAAAREANAPKVNAKQYTFLGKTYDKAPDEAEQTSARQLAMAGVLEKYGDVERGMRLRDSVAARGAAAEDRAFQGKVRPLQLQALERGEREAAQREADVTSARALDDEVGQWFKARLSGPDGAPRAATIDDHLAASQYRAGKLVQAGRIDEAGKVIQQHQAGALAKIQLETADRIAAAQTASAALANGNLDAVTEFYNRYIPDGARVLEVVKGKDGAVVIRRESADGQPMPDQTMKDTNQLMAALNTFRDPMALYQWSQGEFQRNLQLRAEKRADAADGRAAAGEKRAQEVHNAGAPARQVAGQVATLQGTMLNPQATPSAREQAGSLLQGLNAATNPKTGAPAAAKVEGGDVTSLLGDPATDRNGRPLTDPMTGRQQVNRNPAREQDFFKFMAAAGLKDTNEGILRYQAMPAFATEAEVAAAAKAGRVKPGQWVKVGDRAAMWQ